MLNDLQTPYEKGNKNQTTTWAECISWYEELARRIDSPLGSVKSWIRRGLQQLKTCLDG